MKNYYLIFSLVLSFSLNAWAQRSSSNFIESINENQINLNSNQQKKYKAIAGNSLYKHASLVRIGNLAAIEKGGKLPIDIPGRTGRLIAHAKTVEAKSENEFVWIGEFPKAAGTVMIIAKEDRIFGHITVGNNVYEIQDLGNHINVLVQVDETKFTEAECATKSFTSENNSVQEDSQEIDEISSIQAYGLATVRILVLYTQNAVNSVANINDVATLGVQQMNTAISNSEVTNFNVELAGVQQLNFNETTDIMADVQNLTNNSTAQSYRNSYEADVVILLTNGNYGSTFGVVRDIGPINNYAYGIVEVDAAAARYTFAHEVAHLFGARHDTDPTAGYAHAHNFLTGTYPYQTTRRTILNSLPAGEARILHYSNPNVFYNSVATGTSSRNNARKLSEQGATVSYFRSYTPYSVTISGPRWGDNAGTYTWVANVTKGTAPFTFQWHYSYDGSNYQYPFGSTQSVTNQLPVDKDLFLRVTVTDATGAQVTDYFMTSNNSGEGCIKCMADETSAIDLNYDEAINGQQNMYPNPAKDNVTIQFETEIDGSLASLTIYDFSSKVVMFKELGKSRKGRHLTNISVADLEPGLYVLKLQVGNSLETRRLLISK